jgi:7-carboxy-7-deazaguanine synthase
MLTICEIFYSLQGEGPFMGRPAVFVRLSGCVLPYCEFCDTPEALGRGTPTALETIVQQVESYGCSLVVITGGEPFLQWKQGLMQLSQMLIEKEMSIQYETSGQAGIPENVTGIVVLSPKPGKWPSPGIISKAQFLKPLVGDDPQITLESIQHCGFPANRVWLMPLGRSREEQIARMPMVWDLCTRYGYCMSPRLHILAFDQKKGI